LALAVLATERKAAQVSAPHCERNPLVALRKVTLGRSASGGVVGGWHVAVRDEHEQVLAISGGAPAQPVGGLPAPWQGQHPVQSAVQVGATPLRRGVARPVAPSPNGNRARQQALGRRREVGVAAVDGALRVAKQVRQADLPPVRMAALAAEAVGHPRARAPGAERRPHHGCAPAGPDDARHADACDKHPVPPGPACHPHGGLVGGNHGRCAGLSGDGGGRGHERRLGAGQDVAGRALTDGWAEHLTHHGTRPLQADRLGAAQTNRQGLDRPAKRRARLNPPLAFQRLRRRNANSARPALARPRAPRSSRNAHRTAAPASPRASTASTRPR